MKIITLTMKERQRAAILSKLAKVREGGPSTEQLAQALNLSERHLYRLKAKYKRDGSLGLAHGSRGRPSSRRMPGAMEDRIVKFALGKYQGFNDHHLAEKLNEVEGIRVSRRKVSYLLRSRGIAAVFKRRRPKHRMRRKRMDHAGLMLQTDGSPHDWLQGRGEHLTFLGLIDDATNFVPEGFFDEEETTMGYMKLFYETFSKHGLPVSIYADRHTIFQTYREPTLEEQLQNKKPDTQVGRALRELGITLIHASSCQAKGRIERLWRTFQDRLVSELRLAKTKSKYEANTIVKRFIPDYNRRFTRKPANPISAWRPVPRDLDLLQFLCIKDQRTVANDNTVSWRGNVLQIPPSPLRRSFAKAKVEVRCLITKEIQLYFKNQRIAKFPQKTVSLNDLQREDWSWDDAGYILKYQERIAA